MLRSFVLSLLCAAAPLLAQTIYEPIEYEYSVGGTLYFYGGDQSSVHAAAAELRSDGTAAWGRHNGFAFASAGTENGRVVEDERTRVFSDAWRYGLQDATLIGFTIADARNQAHASVPRYFHKAELLSSAPLTDGLRIVSARSGGVTVRKSSGTLVTRASTPLMIIPKSKSSSHSAGDAQALVD